MGKKYYGSLLNRLEEGKTVSEIKPGTDITKYYWSDRACYYVTEVIDQKHIFVKEYHVCADHDKKGGMGHQDWMYFKTKKEEAEYLKKFFPDTETNVTESAPREWVYRYNKWYEVDRWTKEKVAKYLDKNGYNPYFTDKELNKLKEGEEVYRYYDVGNISFGRRDYYYDWSF